MSQKIKELAKVFKTISKTKYYSITFDKNAPKIFESKVGGLPYWTPDKVYPTDSKGTKLTLLAQINFDKEKVESPLPTNGMLQFFIRDDDSFGLNFDNMTEQDGFKVVYHEQVDYKITKDSIENLDIPDSSKMKNSAILKEAKFTMEQKEEFINTQDYKHKEFFNLAYSQVYGKKPKKAQDFYEVLNEKETEQFEKELDVNNSWHKMLGYAYFTQEDPRYMEQYKNYDTLLLQLDSESDILMWGDMGICNFFIPQKSLLEKDFSNVLYSWDCS